MGLSLVGRGGRDGQGGLWSLSAVAVSAENMVNGISREVNSRMGAARSPAQGKGSGPTALAVPSGVGGAGMERVRCRHSALQQHLSL